MFLRIWSSRFISDQNLNAFFLIRIDARNVVLLKSYDCRGYINTIEYPDMYHYPIIPFEKHNTSRAGLFLFTTIHQHLRIIILLLSFVRDYERIKTGTLVKRVKTNILTSSVYD